MEIWQLATCGHGL